MKIAVDLDDTLSRVERYARAHGYIVRNNLPYQLVNEHAQLLAEMFDWSFSDVVDFMRAGGDSIFTEAVARPHAKEVLQKWREMGHTVIILTARTTKLFPNPEKLSRDWLEKRKIPYDELVANCEDKGKYCAENGVSLLVDNSVEQCLSFQRRGGCAILAVSKATLSRAREVRYCGADWTQIDGRAQEFFNIRTLEERTARAVVPRFLSRLDGYEVRSDLWEGFRNNCIRAVSPSPLPFSFVVTEMEERCREQNKTCRFLLTSLDVALDSYLRERGYTLEHNCVMMTLAQIPDLPKAEGVRLYFAPSGEWEEECRAVNGEKYLRDYSLVKGRVLFATAYSDGKPASVATAVLDGDSLGIYDVHTVINERRKGYARKVLSALLSAGGRMGAERAYLQAVTANHAASALYRSLGFVRHHEYWYRVK